MKNDPFFKMKNYMFDNYVVEWVHVRFRAMGVHVSIAGAPNNLELSVSSRGARVRCSSGDSLLHAMRQARLFAWDVVREKADNIRESAKLIRDLDKRARAIRKADRIMQTSRWFNLGIESGVSHEDQDLS